MCLEAFSGVRGGGRLEAKKTGFPEMTGDHFPGIPLAWVTPWLCPTRALGAPAHGGCPPPSSGAL